MNYKLVLWIVLLSLVFSVGVVFAADKDAKASTVGKGEDAAKDAAVETNPKAPTSTAVAPGPENTVDACRDGIDNDGNGLIDCADPECQIFAICVGYVPGTTPPPEPGWKPETDRQCSDGLDNNEDGLIDCHEVSCQRYRYCRNLMYETPEPKNKAPGLFFNFGLGAALPNFRTPTAETDGGGYWTDQYDIPFDPDIGGMLDIKVGYLPLKWLGFGIKLMGAVSAAGNRYEHMFSYDSPDLYKYQGFKLSAYVGGFVRFQWPFDRVVPFLDVAFAGYSFTGYVWKIYDPDNSWEDIHDDNAVGVQETYETDARHYTFALEPGIDFFVVKRKFGIGVKAWLPVVASPTSQSSKDNTGVQISFTITPMWAERPQLKPEYDVTIPKE
jgi:hypothetical protein